MTSIFIVLRNEKIESVFATEDLAKIFIREYGGWNTWKIVEQPVLQSVQCKLFD